MFNSGLLTSNLSWYDLGQVWYLIVSIPDLCNLTYSANCVWFCVNRSINCL